MSRGPHPKRPCNAVLFNTNWQPEEEEQTEEETPEQSDDSAEEKEEDAEEKEEDAEENDEDEDEDEDEDDDDEDEIKDPMDTLREECANSAPCKPFNHHFHECVERVTKEMEEEDYAHKEYKEDCIEEFFHLQHCVNDCVSPTLFYKLK